MLPQKYWGWLGASAWGTRPKPPDPDNRGGLFVVEPQGFHIARTVHDTNDENFGIRETVIQDVIAVEMRPQPFGQIIPARSDFRLEQ
ncbi:MAG: hypothetical protein BECKG1743D_GA0114223_105425 [Candidatus Kentron sp. G]|nr:MAG: hypothetical protein BECKG1743F_GA0114225_103406 [Candidatus Kentron sp. G]VFN03526.1 MAG: hypothetical protein BECKG1743E_GA0114224_106265 [Candidatus Kentron sp. G]VFN04063.1 MAG: hypothetical protein BECKG1743D_GA0114223_105425 [Candidatus Kentron sp. G]